VIQLLNNSVTTKAEENKTLWVGSKNPKPRTLGSVIQPPTYHQ
jgi:hypothetical protein